MRFSLFTTISLFSFACAPDSVEGYQSTGDVSKMFVGETEEAVPPPMDQDIESEPEGQSISDVDTLCSGNIVSQRGAELLIDLARPEAGEDIYMTYARIEGIADIFETCTDPWGLFPTTYKHITARGIEGIEDGAFEDEQWAEDIIVDFAGRYMENLEAALTRGEPSWAWKRYYQLADREDVSKTRSVLMAMSAHLLLDLPHSLAAIDTQEDHKRQSGDSIPITEDRDSSH